MANDAKRISQLGITTSVAVNDRLVVLTNPDSSAQTQTITVNNFAVSISNNLVIANSSQRGVVQVDGTTIHIAANGMISANVYANGVLGTNGQVLTSDGSSVYWNTPFPYEQLYSIELDRSLATSNASQSMFGVGLTLNINTKYRYKIYGTAYKANSNFSSTGAMQFCITNSTATAVLSRSYFLASQCAANNSQPAVVQAYQVSQNITTGFSTPVTITNSNTGSTWYSFIIDGTLDCTTGGTINPQIAFTHTANLGSGTVLQSGATMEIWPIGNATSNAVIGSWA
jgi:hypothetical protein